MLEPDLEPYVGAGPTGAVLLGTAIEKGLFGTCESFGACAFGGATAGLKLGLKLGVGALTGRGFAGAFCTGFCVIPFVTVFCGAGACFLSFCDFFGSVDGDGAAAMRYTEARLSKISMEMLADINKNTIDFTPNFDGTEKEPTVLPSRYPNLLANGTSGIAVGMATNIPPHNLREIINAVVKIIDNQIEENRETTIEEILSIVKGPDFPTGATILGTRGIEEAYRTGRGKIRVRAVTDIETMPNGKTQIIVTELPYMVNKARLIEKIAELVRDKKVDGITAINDHSNREGMRICIELRRDANANVILNQLYKHTQLQDTFGVIMLALVGNTQKVVSLLEMLEHYLNHQ